MKSELTDIRLLSLLSVLPLMLLGVWIISNESFANFGSKGEKYSRVIRVESLGHKASRVRDIGIYFLILSAATIALYLLIAIWLTDSSLTLTTEHSGLISSTTSKESRFREESCDRDI